MEEKNRNNGMPLSEHLLTMAEEMPEWLASLKPGECPDFTKINTRTFFYPGSGFDGSPVKVLNQGHFLHFYVFADYAYEKERAYEEFKEGFKGYHLLSLTDVELSDIAGEWTPHFTRSERQELDVQFWMKYAAYAFCAVYERDPEYGEEHGCKRFAVMFLKEDAYKVYDALYASRKLNCTVMLLQDYGLGGNYDNFGKGGLLERIAAESGVYPDNMLKAKWTDIWDGYSRVDGVQPVYGGWYIIERTLWKRG